MGSVKFPKVFFSNSVWTVDDMELGLKMNIFGSRPIWGTAGRNTQVSPTQITVSFSYTYNSFSYTDNSKYLIHI